MNRLKRLWHSARLFVSVAVVWVGLYGLALAQASDADKKGPDTSAPPYVGPYFVVILCLALGLMVVCNPSRRREKAKPDQYEAAPAEAAKSAAKPGKPA